MDLTDLIYLLNFGKYYITIQGSGHGRYINKVSIRVYLSKNIQVYKYDVSMFIIRIKLYTNIIVRTLSN